MKKVGLLVFSVVLSISCFSQNYKNHKKEIEKIIKSGDYYYATSEKSSNIQSAEARALANLINMIYENCDPNMIFFEDNDDSHNTQSRLVFNTLRSEIKSKSNQYVTANGNDNVEVFRYLKKCDFVDICAGRENLAKMYFSKGLDIDRDKRDNMSIADALRCYYWSLIICYSHPYGAVIKIDDPESHKPVIMKDWVYERIDQLLGSINFIPMRKPVMKDHNHVAYELIVNDGADMIPWLKYEYDNGEENVENTVESGKTSVEMLSKKANNLEIRICIENRKEAEAHSKEVFSIMQQLDSQIYFRSAVKNINIKKAKEEGLVESYRDSTIIEKITDTKNFIYENSVVIYEDYLKVMKNIEKAIRNKDIEDIRYCFTEEGYAMFSKLLSNGRYYILGTPEFKFMKYGDMVICRSIPMQFNFNNNVGFVRNVAFRFDEKTCKVISVAFRLHDIAEIDIMGKKQWKAESRLALVNFLEDYQTAYALKNDDYLEKIFSEDALIVVGTVLKQKSKGDNMQLSDAKKVVYDTMDKKEYLTKLKKVFNSNEFIDIRFFDTDVTKHKEVEYYGIQVKQEYKSSNYGDIGYLFLMVDLTAKLPEIHIRTWEPEKTEKPVCFDDIIIHGKK